MTALWLAPNDPLLSGAERPSLRLVGAASGFETQFVDEELQALSPLALVLDPPAHIGEKRRASVAVRRRRTLLAVIGLLLIGLALPLGGTGGHSHTAGSASAGTVLTGSYTVQPGDTLWSIAERVAPNSDPRPLVAQLAAETGSDTVVPGERLALP